MTIFAFKLNDYSEEYGNRSAETDAIVHWVVTSELAREKVEQPPFLLTNNCGNRTTNSYSQILKIFIL